MNHIFKNSFRHVSGALLTGFLWFFSFPTVLFGKKVFDFGFLAWVALVPLLLAIKNKNLGQVFVLSVCAFFVAQLGQWYWLVNALHDFGFLPFWVSFLVLCLMSFVFALIFALPFFLTYLVVRATAIPIYVIFPLLSFCRDWFLHYFPFGGFPFTTTPYSQGAWLSAFQWIDHTGGLALTLFLSLLNILIAESLWWAVKKSRYDRFATYGVAILIVVLSSLFGSFWSTRQYQQHKQVREPVAVGLVQANISQEQKWSKSLAERHLNTHLELTAKAVSEGAEFVLWPESSYPYSLRESEMSTQTFLERDSFPVPLLFGSVVVGDQHQLYNAAVLVNTQAQFVGASYKTHLVPFGEYVPLKNYLGFLRGMLAGVGEFTAGQKPFLFEFKGLKWGSLICFEDVFFAESRSLAELQADVLVNFTNDAWYGNTSAYLQHAVFSQMRALETRRPLLRVTNTGLSAAISPHGELLDVLPAFERASFVTHINPDFYLSPFVKCGMVWGKPLVFFTGLVVVYALVKMLLGPLPAKESHYGARH